MILNVFEIWAVETFMYPHLYSIPCVAKRSFTFLACINLNLLLLSTSESLALPNQFVVQSQGENSTCITTINSNSNKFWKVISNIFYVEFLLDKVWKMNITTTVEMVSITMIWKLYCCFYDVHHINMYKYHNWKILVKPFSVNPESHYSLFCCKSVFHFMYIFHEVQCT